MAKITVQTVPSSGKSTSQDVEVKDSGASLADVVKQTGIQVAKMQVSVDGEPVDGIKPHLVHVKAGAKVTITEKAAGS